MTTIAFDGLTLAADTQVNSGNGAFAGTVTKIGQAKDGSLWGFSGSLRYQERFVTWTDGPRDGDPPKVEEGVCILISPSGVVREWWEDGWIQVDNPFHAWGSGERIARGALMAGADAVRAVEIAIALDGDSGGKVTALDVGGASEPFDRTRDDHETQPPKETR